MRRIAEYKHLNVSRVGLALYLSKSLTILELPRITSEHGTIKGVSKKIIIKFL